MLKTRDQNLQLDEAVSALIALGYKPIEAENG